MEKNNNSNWFIKHKVWTIAIAIILFTFIAGFFGDSAPNKIENKPQQTTKAAQEDTSDLDLTVKPNVISLKITNNQDKSLENCEVQVNPGTFNSGYTSRVNLPAHTPVDIPYSTLAKDTEKFDSDKYAVKNIVVTRCNGQPSRIGVYGN